MPSEAWSWAVDSQFPSFCLVFARSKTIESVMAAFGADPGAAASMTRMESLSAFPEVDVDNLLRVGTVDGWVFCYEDRNLLGITGRVRKELSRECETLSIYKGGDGMRTFEHMEGGRTIEFFEPRRHLDVQGEGPYVISDLVRGKLAAASPGMLGMTALGLALTEHFGLQLDRELLEGPLLTVPA
ncbi:DUF6461 domain-containing protein [Streptomyces olivaceus]|uniref:DUF6461 domain-containing protein n=1 Tax=Streptomyces olivaceus TaxID=47716 RepID=UPI0012FF1F1D|nr:DUF6461 domain-containing protein [Streptomyces olivaceus]MBZ6108021.1 hypothetical protein [Streptomyces olivaceus]